MMRMTILAAGLLAGTAPGLAAEPVAYWHFDEGKAGEAAAELLPAGGGAALAGRGAVYQQGTPPVFDALVPAATVWDGGTLTVAHAANGGSLRFGGAAATGGGSPVGGEVTVDGREPRTHLAQFTLEAMVKMDRQMPRHALLASKRRNGQTGASWSLSIDPQGVLRARFDTQPGPQSGGEGFNQSFGSTANLGDGAWHHVALCYDGAARTATLYADHVRCGGGVTKGPLVYDDGPLVLGRGLDGWLDEVRLSAAALHPEQFLRPTRFFSELKPRVPTVALLDQTPTRVQTALKVGWTKLGTLKPKSTAQIETSMWSLGCETLDRDLADWEAYKEYLAPLGIRHIRLQGGWGRTERQKGVYDFAWLDRIVDDALARGLEVCLETSYGNRLYEPTAALGPGGSLPEGEETLAAWDRWVEAMARRYSAKGVRQWMMYNEPNLVKSNTIAKTTALNVRTARIIKRVDPQARIGGLVSCSANAAFVEGFLRGLAEQGELGLFEWVVYHHYSGNPDATYDKVARLQQLVSELAPGMRLWQGEAGGASEEVQFALSGIEWTEMSQAKWNTRRMLGDLARGIRSSVFTISDLSYHKDFISRYGLLKTDARNAIIKVKTAYYAVQNVVSVFNDALQRAEGTEVAFSGGTAYTAHAFCDKATGLGVIALWDGRGVPSNECTASRVEVRVSGARFAEPVWVDLLTGQVYAIPSEAAVRDGQTWIFREVPVYDGPAVITDRSVLSFEPARIKKKASNPMAAGTD